MKSLARLTVLSLLISSCAKEALDPLSEFGLANLDYALVEADFCTAPPAPNKQKIKYVFVLDHSQSNQPGVNPTPGDVTATDPNGERRYGPLLAFIRDLEDDPFNIPSFNLINFNDSASPAPGLDLNGFMSDKDNFKSILRLDWQGTGPNPMNNQPRDGGFTDYKIALSQIATLLRNDVYQESLSDDRPIVKTQYKVIFVSDGAPVIANTEGGPSLTKLQDFDTDLVPELNKITNLKDDPAFNPFIAGIEFNTVYYYTDVPLLPAEALLQQMSDAGDGKFYKFGGNDGIYYQAFAPPSRNLKNSLVDVFVENENVVWWEDGKLEQSIPGDGFPDSIRAQYSSVYNRRDTDDNGVSDMVEFKTKGTPCKDENCLSSGQDPYTICDGFEPYRNARGELNFRSTAGDGFNDCEKFLLRADLNSFNTNGDFVPDFLKVKNKLAYLAKTNNLYQIPFNDGTTNYMKLKLGLPVSAPKDKIPLRYRSRKNNLRKVANDDPNVDCYKLRVEDVAILRGDDKIRVWLVQNPQVVEDNPFVKISEKSLDFKNYVKFERDDFL